MSFDKHLIEEKMNKSLHILDLEFKSLRTGRANSEMFEHIKVEVYGSHTPLNQVAGINVLDSSTLSISVWDRANVAAVGEAIHKADLGLGIIVEGDVIRITVPPLTEERRKDIIKIAKEYAENAKISVRNIRRTYMEDLKKQEKGKEMSEDESKWHHDEVQQITDKFTALIDEHLKEKEKEILTI